MQTYTLEANSIKTCHVCFAIREPVWFVKVESLDEMVAICAACLHDIYAIDWHAVESD